jgi:hypothetical protein
VITAINGVNFAIFLLLIWRKAIEAVSEKGHFAIGNSCEILEVGKV